MAQWKWDEKNQTTVLVETEEIETVEGPKSGQDISVSKRGRRAVSSEVPHNPEQIEESDNAVTQ